MDEIFLLELQNVPILKQLQIEEALLRHNFGNVCIFNYGAPKAIVMGISGKAEELIDLERARQDGIPIIKRFSGGGTVIVDPDTLFVSFLFRQGVHPFAAFPENIMRWSKDFYQNALGLDGFDFQENDYVIGDKKIGGNAQHITRYNWVHHTTFLYDYSDANMDYLLMPKKRPSYRGSRSHTDFLTKLKEHLSNKQMFYDRIREALEKNFNVKPLYIEKAIQQQELAHRTSTKVLY